MIPVKSCNVRAIDIAGPNLIVQFHNGLKYIYFEAAHEFENMLRAPSKGSFVHTHLKNRYRSAIR